MSEIPEEAVTAAGNALRELWLQEFPGTLAPADPMDWAKEALEAAEKVWPHNPPGHDYASTTQAVTSIAPKQFSYYRHRFGFGPPEVKS